MENHKGVNTALKPANSKTWKPHMKKLLSDYNPRLILQTPPEADHTQVLKRFKMGTMEISS